MNCDDPRYRSESKPLLPEPPEPLRILAYWVFFLLFLCAIGFLAGRACFRMFNTPATPVVQAPIVEPVESPCLDCDEWPRREATGPAKELDDWGSVPDGPMGDFIDKIPPAPLFSTRFAYDGTRWEWQMNGRGELRHVYVGKSNIVLMMEDAEGNSLGELKSEPEPGKIHINDLPAPCTVDAFDFKLPPLPTEEEYGGPWPKEEPNDEPIPPPVPVRDTADEPASVTVELPPAVPPISPPAKPTPAKPKRGW